MIELYIKTEKKNATEILAHQWKKSIVKVHVLRDAGFNIKSQFTYSIFHFIVDTHSVGA